MRSPFVLAGLLGAMVLSFATTGDTAPSVISQSDNVRAIPARPPASVAVPSAPTNVASIGQGPENAWERLNGEVKFNPFGTLNMRAGLPPLEQPKIERPAPLHTPVTKSAPATPIAPLPPPPPVAPPLPFVAVGSIAGAQVTDGKKVAFIRQQDQLLLVRAGDAIGSTYRVESVTEQRIEFTYLPLKQRQTLALAP